MSWRFRKIFGSGPFRASWTKKGVGFSFGFPGLRCGVSPDGRRYISVGIPRTGLYWIKYFDSSSKQQQQQPGSQSPNSQSPALPNSTQNQKQPWWKQKGLGD
jgi:hypothetical protein